MGLKGRPSISKRQKELARQEKNQKKTERKAQRKVEKAGRPEDAGAEDPDIAGIVPGPQPIPEE